MNSMREGAQMYDVLGLFAGLGWSAQLKELGISELGIDIDKHVIAVRRANGMDTLQLDLWNLRPQHVSLLFKALIGSPSCKRWSLAGDGAARTELTTILGAVKDVRDGKALNVALKDVDPEAALVLAPLEWAAFHRPEWIALEQVSQVQPVWDATAEALRVLGYSVDTGIVTAEQYGTPQTRRRSILVANRTTDVRLPSPTHSKYYARNKTKRDPGLKPFVTLAEGLGWDPQDLAGFPRRDDGRGDAVEINGELYRARDLHAADAPAPTVTEKARSWRRFRRPAESVDNMAPPVDAAKNTNVAKALPDWAYERPSTTIVGSFRPDIVAAPGYWHAGDGPRQNAPDSVAVSVQEAAILQGFPDWIDFSALTNTAAHKVIGNGVPGQLAKATILAAQGVR